MIRLTERALGLSFIPENPNNTSDVHSKTESDEIPV
jgi:hypothetical protein